MSTDDIRYSSEAVVTEHLFFQNLNSINIFVEDAGKEYVYETIFKRMLGSQYTVKKIFGVGGKKRLKEVFKELGAYDVKYKRHNLYLADGDFDRYIYSEQMIHSSHFIYLKAYNIESYLIDKNACISFVKRLLRCLDDEAEEKLNFEGWRSCIVAQAVPLYFYYCYVQDKFPNVPNTGRKPCEFLDSKTGFARESALDNYKRVVYSLDADAEIEIQKIKELYYKQNNDDGYNLICGKFILTSLYHYIRSFALSSFQQDDLEWWLVDHFDVGSLNYVKNQIIKIIESGVR